MGTPEHTLPAVVHKWASRRPQGLALRQGERSLTWRQLDKAVQASARALLARGLVAGDRVMLLGENSVEWVVTFLGAQRARIIVAPTNTRLSPAQVAEQARVLDAQAVIFGAELVDLVAEARDAGFACVEVSVLAAAAAELLEDPEGPEGLPFAAAEEPALVSFTSGTTGVPKGATISHGALYEMARSFSTYFQTGPDDTTLVMVPIFHNTGFVDQLAHMILSGGATSLLSRYRTSLAVEELVEHPVTYLAAVPSMLRMLMMHEGADQVFDGIGSIMFGGSPMPGAWTEEVGSRWPHLRLVHAYGLSEFTSVCTFLPPDMVSTKGESVGLPLPGVDVKVMADGRKAEVRETGEVWISGATRMIGYWRRPDLTSEKFVDRWLRTGDLGYLDDDGYLWLAGRQDDVINRGGEKILPTFVESQIARHASIATASVFAYPDEVLQQRVAAAVELRAGWSFDEDALRLHLAQSMPDYAIPDRWVLYDELPLTASGKVDRRAVAAAGISTPGMPREAR
ncbi:class I adenylate-forming enzyme family protein [Nocardioides hungaricus]